MADHKKLAETHRRHEHERAQMDGRQHAAHHEMQTRHMHARMQMNSRHEAEMAAEQPAEGQQAAPEATAGATQPPSEAQ
jgi:hypothetical protein